MKPKPLSHKADNAFKFESFNERVAKIRVSTEAERHVFASDSDEQLSNFAETYIKWHDFNCSDDFEKLKSKIGNVLLIQTLPQVLLRKNDLHEALKQNLSLENKALDAALELTSALASDLNAEYYPYFMETFEILVDFVKVKDAEILENVFVCLAKLFETLSRHVVKDFDTILTDVASKLLSEKQPEYVRDFASQCFAFVARKANEKKNVIRKIFALSGNSGELARGLGHLCSEVVHLETDQFHECAENFISDVLELYLNSEYTTNENVTLTFRTTFALVVEFISKANSGVLWKNMFKYMTLCRKSYPRQQLIKLLYGMIHYKRGKIVLYPDELAKCLTESIEVETDIDNVQELYKCASTFLLNSYQCIRPENIRKLCNCIRVKKVDLKFFFQFVGQLQDYPMFDRDISSQLGSVIESKIEDEASTEYVICSMAEVINSRHDSAVVHDLNAKKFLFNFSSGTVATFLLNTLKCDIVSSQAWCILHIFPHIRPLPCTKELCETALEVVNATVEHLSHAKSDMLLPLLLKAMTVLAEIGHETFCQDIDFSKLMALIHKYAANIFALQCLDVYLVYSAQLGHLSPFDSLNFEKLYITMEKNLSSPSSTVRLLTLHILSLFDVTLPPTENEIARTQVFKSCYLAEAAEPSVMEYREKIKFLNNLDSRHVGCVTPIEGSQGTNYELAPLRYLLGSMYVNLSLLWQSIEKLIESFVKFHKNASGVRSVLIEHFQATEEILKDHQPSPSVETVSDKPTYVNAQTKYALEIISNKKDRPDHSRHRQNLLNAFQKYADFFEPSNRFFVDSFLSYIEYEICSVDTSIEHGRENIKSSTVEAGSQDEIKSKSTNVRVPWKTVIAYLKVFANFKNPKAVYKEPILTRLYEDFLRYPDSEIQKAALKCLIAYSLPHLSPYKEKLLELLDDKTFRDAIKSMVLNPKVDEDKFIVNDHREKFMPILMRILYGRMLSKTGGHSSGRAQTQNRRATVFRFLVGCNDMEIKLFTDLALTALAEYARKPYAEMLVALKNIDLESCVPVKRVMSSVKTVSTILQYMGSLVKKSMHFLFQYILAACGYSTELLAKKDLIKPSVVNSLKALRSECFKVLMKFFNEYDAYEFSTEEINALFSVIVSPLLESLERDCVTSPTPLLYLFTCWAENSRYFPLLRHEAGGVSPIGVVINIFKNDKTHSSVMATITHLLESLVTLAVPEKMQTDEVSLNTDYLTNHRIDRGVDLILPYIPVLLMKYNANFSQSLKSKNRKIKISKQDLVILSEISKCVENDSERSALSELLLEALYKNFSHHRETAGQFIRTIKRLAEDSGRLTDNFVRLVCPLFGLVTDNGLRQDVCNLLAIAAKQDSDNEFTAKVASGLNACSYRHIDEPDFEKRFEAFKLINSRLEDDNLPNIRFFEMIVYNACFTIRESNDTALKDAAVSVVDRAARKIFASDDKMLINKVCVDLILFKEVKTGLKHEKELVRHEFIGILNRLANYGRDKHHVLQQLALLCHRETEQNFWENARHIQSRVRVKSFSRLAASKDLLRQINSEVLISFLLPLPASCISDVRNSSANLVTASIELIGSIASSVSWHNYETLLRHYLKLLSKQKENLSPIIRAISVILTNFNFDLSNAVPRRSGAEKSVPDVTTVETEENEVLESEHSLSVCQGTSQLSVDEATKIFHTITGKLLPDLKRCLYEMSFTDYEHDSMKKEHPEDEQMQRIPIAIALVQLLLTLPAKFNLLETNLPGIFLRLCHFLKSRAESVRESARKSLLKVMQSLGFTYFPFLLRELKTTLSRGYQMHVLSYTIHSLLVNMTEQIDCGGLDNCLDSITAICINDILGDVSEEKEVGKIVGKLKEAKKSKSYDTYYLLGTFVGEASIRKLVLPLQKLLSTASSHASVRKISTCIQKLMVGLSDNKGLKEETLLAFIHAVAKEEIFHFEPKKMTKAKSSVRQRASCLLIAPERPRGIKPVKTTPTTNIHIVVEQVFQLLHILVKKERLNMDSAEHLALLDPFVALLSDYLSFKGSSKLVSASLRCLQSLVNLPQLPSLVTHCNRIKNTLFVLIQDLSGNGSREGDRLELLVLCFKTMACLLRDLSGTQISQEQLCVLLSYIDQDLAEDVPKSTTFVLLKSILTRKMSVAQLDTVMAKVIELSVQSEVEHIRNQSWTAAVKYLLEYPHGKHLKGHVIFFTRQLEYEHEFGRETALRVLNSLTKAFPRKLLESFESLLLVPLACRLINEESANCKKLVVQCIEELVGRVSEEKRDDIFNKIVVPWLQHSALAQRRLAVHLVAVFINVEKEAIEKRLDILLPLMSQQLDPLRYQEQLFVDLEEEEKAKKAKNAASAASMEGVVDENEREKEALKGKEQVQQEEQEKLEKQEREQQAGQQGQQGPTDHFIYQNLSTFSRLLRLKPTIVRSSRWAQHTNAVLDSVYSFYLLYPHAWVRLISVQLFGILFLNYSPQVLAKAIMNQEQEKKEEGETNLTEPAEYLLHDTKKKLSGLCKGFFKLMQNIYQTADLGEQIVKNLAFVAKTIILVEAANQDLQLSEPQEEKKEKRKKKPFKLVERETVMADETLRLNDNGGNKVYSALSLTYLLERLNKEMSKEMTANGDLTERRICSFKLMAAIIVETPSQNLVGHQGLKERLDPKLGRRREEQAEEKAKGEDDGDGENEEEQEAKPPTLLELLMIPLVREVTNKQNENNDKRHKLVLLAQQVLDLIKSIIGEDEFGLAYAMAQIQLRRKRAQRKKEKALELVLDPEKGLRLRRKKHLKKRLALKRKHSFEGRMRTSTASKKSRKHE
ncbi:Small subunit processome component 20 -like protein [Halotydeus destructor]|nr:Small subunit processome component 20 -like protein [Halotydeus destructor]